jgi:hypothetical protein
MVYLILTSGDSSIGGKAAVGHVIASDFRSHSSPIRNVDLGSWRDDKKTVPVILAIGSNYSRGASHLTDTVRTFSPSGMAEELTALINRVLGLHPLAAVLKTDVESCVGELFSMDYKSIMVQPFCVRAGYPAAITRICEPARSDWAVVFRA